MILYMIHDDANSVTFSYGELSTVNMSKKAIS